MLDVALHLLLWPLALLWCLALLARIRHRPRPELRLEERGHEPDSSATVSVIVPARNEAANIERCVAGLLAQDHPNLELIVVDDRSEDDTGKIARDAGGERVRVLYGEPPPPGWFGKPNACRVGAAEASGSWLLFLDADVQLAPWTIRRAVALAESRSLGLLSLWGTWALESFWEYVLIPAIGGFVRLAHPLSEVNDPETELAFANGQFLLFRRSSYEAIGGHERVASEVLEDVALGRAVKRDGQSLGMLLSPAAFRVRLYRSFREVWDGFSKNIYAGMGRRPGRAIAAAALLLGMHVVPLVAAAASLALGLGPVLVALGLFCTLATMGTRALDEREGGRSGLWALTHPLANGILALIIANSALRHHLGSTVRWKGRSVKP